MIGGDKVACTIFVMEMDSRADGGRTTTCRGLNSAFVIIASAATSSVNTGVAPTVTSGSAVVRGARTGAGSRTTVLPGAVAAPSPHNKTFWTMVSSRYAATSTIKKLVSKATDPIRSGGTSEFLGVGRARVWQDEAHERTPRTDRRDRERLYTTIRL